MQSEDISAMRLLKMSEVARILDISEARAYELVRLGVLPKVEIRRQIRINPDRLREFIEGGGRGL